MGDFGLREEHQRKLDQEAAELPATVKFDRRKRPRDTGPRDRDLVVGMEVLLIDTRQQADGPVVRSVHVVEINHGTRSVFSVQGLADGRCSRVVQMTRPMLYRVDCVEDLKRLAETLIQMAERAAEAANRIAERAEDLAIQGG